MHGEGCGACGATVCVAISDSGVDWSERRSFINQVTSYEPRANQPLSLPTLPADREAQIEQAVDSFVLREGREERALNHSEDINMEDQTNIGQIIYFGIMLVVGAWMLWMKFRGK